MQVIVIEEFSMLSASFFELLEEVARRTKGSSLPFGGVRLMLVGDVAQLPPVGDFTMELGDDGQQEVHRRAPRFAFQSHLWSLCKFENYKLDHCWRYDIHSELGQFLTELRVAHVMTDALYQTCKRLLQNKAVTTDDAVTLSCTNDVARSISKTHLDRLPQPEHAYYAVDRHGRNVYINNVADEGPNGNAHGPMFTDERNLQRPVFGSMSEPAVLRLRVGAKVLSTAKVHDRVRTGAIGVVVTFDDGLLDVVDPHDFGYHVDAQQVNDDMIHVAPHAMWPQVEFTGVDGKLVLVTLRAKQVDVQDNMGTTLCSRTQVPLVLAYSITVHRSQGLTLPAVIMLVSKLFACGQLYTGLSRVRDFDKLRVTGVLSYSTKLCDKRVRDFELGTIWTRIANGPDDPGMSQVDSYLE